MGMAVDVTSTTGSDAQDARDYSDATGANFPSVILTQAILNGARITYTPTTVIVDSNGKILYKYIGVHSEQEWINIIETLYASL